LYGCRESPGHTPKKSGVDVAKNNHTWVAIPADSVTALFSNTSKARSGKASIMNFKELPEGIAGVIPLLFFRFSGYLISLNQKRLGISEEGFLLILWISPVLVKFSWSMVFYLVFFGLF
jgi:hypothetical protein